MPPESSHASAAARFEFEELISLEEAAQLLKCSYKSVRRYCDPSIGHRGLVMRSVRIGGKIKTTHRWIKEFIDANLTSRGEQYRLHEPPSSNDAELQAARERVYSQIGNVSR